MSYKSKNDIKQELLAAKEMVIQHRKLGVNSSEFISSQKILNDRKEAYFAIRRAKKASTATTAFPTQDPLNSDFWLHQQRQRDNLFKSAIVEILENAKPSVNAVINLCADLIVSYVGVVESSINDIELHAKTNGSIYLAKGKEIPVKKVTNSLNQLPLAPALWQILNLDEKLLISRQKSKKNNGGKRSFSDDAKIKELRRVMVKDWEESIYRSQDEFIEHFKRTTTERRAEFFKLVTLKEIKSWLKIKKPRKTP